MPPDSVESDVADLPFPGAHSQVPGARSKLSGDSTSDICPTRSLPLDAVRERSDRGWVVRLPVRSEHITVSKEVVISERVVLRRAVVGDVVQVESVVQREQLRLETDGRVNVAGSADEADRIAEESQQQPEHLAARQGLPWRHDTS